MVKDSVNNKSSQMVVAKMTAEEEIEYMKPKGGSQQGLKKGPWTATEDAILMEYVKKHGEGNWNSVQKNSGLMRCGKSCRLRWANHLRPNLKKGSFTPEEERLIIHLHSKIGNKWARMASQLPGRTDNEIKNFWNTRMKRRQRAGLPLYSNEFQESTSAFQLHHRRRRRHQQQEQHKHNPNSQASSLTSFLSSSSHHQKIAYSNYNHSLSSIVNPKITSSHSIDPFQNHLASSFYPNETQCKFYGNVNGNDGSLAMALYHKPHSCPSIFNQNLVEQAMLAPPSQPLQSLHYNGLDFDENVSFTSLIMGGHVGPVGIVPGLNFEIPHDRTPQLTTPLSTPSNTDDVGGVCDVDSSNQNPSNDQEIKVPVMESDGNSGLLDALLHQSNHIAQKEKSNNENRISLAEFDHKGKGVMSDELKKEEEEEDEEATKNVELLMRNGNEVSGENQCDEMSFSQSSIGYGGTTNPSEEHAEKMNSIEDDLLSLLNFPSSTPPPEWYQQTRNASNASLSNGHDNGGLKIEQVSSSDDPTATENAPPELERALGSYYWNNMPNICEEHPHQDLHVLHGN